MNYWVLAFYYKWATADMVKQAMRYNDCSIEDLAEGVNKKLITPDQYKEITGKPFKGFFILP
ncbi:XkdX family protein [Bacillus atrophaeus]|uniref:XkdX family protein n=1 Tax=Bacillus atrophaeus TaxID=1452 RepID=UPI002E2451AB|nr:XkdX family protein [Bacillus atrophaeus]